MKANILNIFVHIPKTAGERVKRNIEASLPQKSFIHANFSHFAHYYNINNKKKEFCKGEEHFVEYINSLTAQQKEKIRCVGGHDSYYGIHEFFKHQPRYLIFFRDPIARTISLYNYERTICKSYSDKKYPLNMRQEKALQRIRENFLINGQVPAFEEWLIEAYDKKIPFYYSMTKYLKHLKFFNDDTSERSILEGLRKFHFIGITERYNEDAFFLYHELGVKKFAFDAHASTPYVTASTLDSKVTEKIKELNETDIYLYQAAVNENDRFKKSNVYFHLSVKKIQDKEKMLLFKQALYSRISNIFIPFWIRLKLKLKSYSLFVYLNSKIPKKKHVIDD